MEIFRPYEKSVLKLLLKTVFAENEITRILQESEFVGYEYTGSGYFLACRHDDLPSERQVCDEPIVIGEVDGITCGFVIFLQDKELALESHPWADKEVPEDFRDKDVKVSAVRIESGKFAPLLGQFSLKSDPVGTKSR